MVKSLESLVEMAKKVRMSEDDVYEQRISFAYGTAHIENETVTRQMVENAARKQQNVTG